jgi:uncharacterized membrane protein YfcA
MNLLDGSALGLVIAMVTAPVGVSGAVFLLPAQLSLLNVPSPAVTPTNMLFNVVAVPGALARYGWRDAISSRLARQLLVGTVPGVVIGAVVRVFVVPGGAVFRVLIPNARSTTLDARHRVRAGWPCGGYIGAGLQSRVPRDGLRRVLGALAAALAVAYLAQVIHG